jgi:hypothetical protein
MKNLKYLCTFLLLLFISDSYAQMYFISKSKFGAINKKGDIVIPPMYDEPLEFYNEIAIITKNELRGLIDSSGKILIEPQYQEIHREISEGLVAVKQNGQWGYINLNNEIIIDFQFDGAVNFCNGIAKIKQGKFYGFINSKGEQITPIMYQKINFGDKVLAKKGEKIYEISLDSGAKLTEEQLPKEKYYFRYHRPDCNIKKTSPELYDPNFMKRTDLTIDYEIVRDESLAYNGLDKDKYGNPGGYGLKNRKGRYKIKPKMNNLSIRITEDIILLRTPGKLHWLNHKGKEIFVSEGY